MQLVPTTVLLSLLTSVFAATKFFTLDLAYSRQSPDGFAMDMMLANGQIDYPIVVNRGDTVVVKVVNNLNVSTAIHWHGMYQKGTQWMDGAAMVTQCPIQPGDVYIYEFNVGDQVGTYWWHAHFKSQYINGLRGPFIIKDPRDPYLRQYDYDLTMTLTDFFHNGSDYLLNNIFYNANNTNADEPVPESGLIGGVGRYDCSITQSKNKNCKNNNPLKQYTVTPGKRYRIRLINTAAQAHYTFSIDGHNLTVIEQDGVYTNPTVVNEISIHSAQRYSFILTANAAASNYWIRAVMFDTWTPTPTNLNGLNMDVRAILSYSTVKAATPITKKQAAVVPLVPYLLGELNGLKQTDLPDFWSYNQTLYMSFAYGPPFYSYPTATISIDSDNVHFRDSQYKMPMPGMDRPTLQSLLQNPTAPRLPDTINPVTVHNNEWVFLMIQNADAMEHPFHIHGHSFYILGAGNLRHQSVQGNGTLPRRDTIQVPACVGGTGGTGEQGCLKGFVNLAIKFDNPGAWLFHCHVEWHMSAGLVMTFINNGDGAPGALPDLTQNPDAVPWYAFDTC
ncbi:hypothetical protein HDU79_000547 [Rhizoclosmatium sp. JEL0117]|nr:hypothetical protein HDU79_000547 [Rhizoclosmatium sp. JEL0117]